MQMKSFIKTVLYAIFIILLAQGAIAASFTYDITYDGAGRVTGVVVDDQNSASYKYMANGRIQEVKLGGTGTVIPVDEPVASFSLSDINFGSQEPGVSGSSETVLLSNTGTQPLTISSITATGDFQAVNDCGTTLNPGEECNIDVIFTPSSLGSQNGTLTITSNADGSPHIIALSGIGGEDVALPVADFSSSTQSLCIGDSVTFSDLSLNSPDTWSWSFPGGTPETSTAQTPSVTYDTAGTYSVALTVSNVYGSDSQTKTAFITVGDGSNVKTVPQWNWTQIPSSRPITSDGNGYIYTTETSSSAFHVKKRNESGTVVNTWQVITNSYAQNSFGVQDIEADSSGNFYLTGTFYSNRHWADPQMPLYFGTIPLESNQDYGYEVFMAKYNSSGNAVWAKRHTGSDTNTEDRGIAIGIDNNGYAYLTGYFYGDDYPANTTTSIRFDTLALGSTGNYANLFLTKYNAANGSAVWARQFKHNNFSSDSAAPIDLIADSAGNTFLTGRFTGTITSPWSLTASGRNDMFVAKYRADGDSDRVRQYGGYNPYTGVLTYDEGNGICLDQSGNYYVTGRFTETASFGTTSLTSYGTHDMFVAKFSGSSITTEWAVQAGGSSSDKGVSITADNDGNLYVLGQYYGPATFGTEILEGTSGYFVAKYSSTDGSLIWVTKLDSVTAGTKIIANSNGTVFVQVKKSDGKDYIGKLSEVPGCEDINPVITVSDPDPCEGETVTLTAPSGYSSYTWSNGATTRSITVKDSGNYSVEIVDCVSGCSDVSDPLNISFKPLPDINLGTDQTIDPGQNITLDAGAGYTSYLWSDGSTGQTLALNGSVIGQGTHTYTVTVINSSGCSDTDSINITVRSLPDLVIYNQIFNPATLSPGQSLDYTYTLTNQGDLSSAETLVKFYLSSDEAYVKAEETWIGQNNIPVLGSGQSVTNTISLTMPSSLEPANWYIVSFIDPGNFVTEQNENNNIYFNQISIIAPQLSLPVNSLDSGQYGWNWGSGANKDSLTVTFESDGNDRLFHVQSYDMDYPDEVGVYLNGTFMGYLTGGNDVLGPDTLWYLPISLQTAGENTIELRQKTSGWKWGVQRLGIFDMGSSFGNLKTLPGDTDHSGGVELHFPGGESRTLDLAGFDSDWADEIVLKLNSNPYGGLPQGPDGGWTDVYLVALNNTELNSGDNILNIYNKDNPTYNWGVKIIGFGKPCDIVLPVNALDETPHGWNWGDVLHQDSLTVCFTGNGTDRMLHVQSYDIDFPDEISIRLNDTFIGYLTGANDTLGKDSLWLLPASLQNQGATNRIEFRQKTSGWKWGVQRLGIFDMGSDFGNLKSLAGGDTAHPDGVEFHFQGNDACLLEVAGFDSDWADEIGVILNNIDVGGLPKGINDGWSDTCQLYLPSDLLNSGDNTLTLFNRDNPGYCWGIRLNTMQAGGTPLGNKVPNIPVNHVEKAVFLIPTGISPKVLNLSFYDNDSADELEILVNGISTGFVSQIADNAWTADKTVLLNPGQLALVEINNTFNPPASYMWGTKITGLADAADTDNDGLPDVLENATCTDPNNADTDADGIPDGVEDRNQNGAGDEGETDPCDADSDGDTLSDGEEDANRNGITDAGETSPLESDTDGDGLADNVDSAPLDASAACLLLPVNDLDSGQYGWNWGTGLHQDGLTACFDSDGADRLLHVRSYDMDFPDEISIWVNGTLLGYLTGVNDDSGSDTLWRIPAELQQAGENTIEFRQKTPGWKWGIDRLGIFDMNSDFGNLKTLTQGDIEHPNGVKLCFTGNESIVLELAGFDSDWVDEIGLDLNGVPYDGLPRGTDGGWTESYKVIIPGTELNTDMNVLKIFNRDNPAYNWGVKIQKFDVLCDLTLPENTLDTVQYGWNWGTGQHKDGLAACFTSDGTDRLLHVQSYDMDFPDEVGVWVNENFLGYLTGVNDALGQDALWLIPGSMQVNGENLVEFRQKTSGWKWGITRLGIFDMSSDFGNLKTLADGDTAHLNGVELHFQGADSGLVEVAAFDSDWDDEIEVRLNSTVIGGLPGGPDEGWTEPYQIYLPLELLNAEDNMLSLYNATTPTYNWGIKINAVRAGDAAIGNKIPGITVNHVNAVAYLVPAGQAAKLLNLSFYDVDSNDEIQITANGIDTGLVAEIADNAWTQPYSVNIDPNPGALTLVEVNHTYNPPSSYMWGTKISGFEDAPPPNEIRIPEEYSSIQAGINAAAEGFTVLVSPGTYTENLNFNGKKIIVKSEQGPEVTIIDGGHSGRVLTFSSGETTETVLSGFTITNGYATSGAWPENSGGGILCKTRSTPVLENLIISGNQATWGGGISCIEAGPVLRSVNIRDNTAFDCGGAMYLAGTSATPNLNGVLIDNNSANTSGGGIFCNNSSYATLVNVTITENSGSGGALYFANASGADLMNTVIWANTPQQVRFWGSGGINPMTISYSDIQDGQAGFVDSVNATISWLDGNITTDPLFIDAANGDFRLNTNSPAVDGGNPDSQYNDAALPPGQGTIRDDMGAYGGEYPF